jgi:hypothetical protein
MMTRSGNFLCGANKQLKACKESSSEIVDHILTHMNRQNEFQSILCDKKLDWSQIKTIWKSIVEYELDATAIGKKVSAKLNPE